MFSSLSTDEKEGLGPSGKPVFLEPVATSERGHDTATIVQLDGLQRRLGNRQIQLFAIGGSIGTALFMSIGSALHNGGPGGLLIASTIHCVAVALVNNCMVEMTTYMPVSGGFVRLAGHWVDDVFGFMAGGTSSFTKPLPWPSRSLH